MMKHFLPVAFIILLVVLIAAGTVQPRSDDNASSPDGVVLSFYNHIKAEDYRGAFSLLSSSSNVDFRNMYRDIAGKDGSLKTLSHLQKVDTRLVDRHGDSEATVRANLQWSTAVGVLNESKDVKVVRDNSQWRVVWPEHKDPNLPPQVIPVNYLRWDVIHRDSEEEWGAQNVEAPHVRIVSMNPVEKDGKVIILGEIVNEDTVPGFVSVDAVLIGKNGQATGQESSFDKISHVLLPKEVSPFRIDFEHTRLADVKKVTLNPASILVPASADPVIAVLHQRLEKGEAGHVVLKGELQNQSGQMVNIPHVIATFYDNSGKVIWVSDGYVDQALRPQIPIPFGVDVRDDVAANVHSYRVTVNHFTMDRPGS